MREVRSAIGPAHGAVATRVERLPIFGEDGVTDMNVAVVRQCASVASAAGRVHAIEEIDSGVDSGDQVAHRADAHQVTRLSFGEQGRGEARHAVHFLVRLSHGKSADRVSGQIERDDFARTAFARAFIEPALYDSEDLCSCTRARFGRAPGPE